MIDWGIWWKAEHVYQQAMRPKTLNLTAQSMFEKQVKEEKIHDLNLQPRTCSHPINARTLTGVCQAVRIFSSCIFQESISIGTFVSNSLSLSTTDGTKWTSFNYDWGIWWKAEPVYQQAMRPKTLNLTAQSMFKKQVKEEKSIHGQCPLQGQYI